jgi:hypothetical protein
MGLPEYQSMPSLRDVAHDGVLCTFSHLVTDQPTSDVVRQGRRHGPSIYVQNHILLGHSPPAYQADRRVGPDL